MYLAAWMVRRAFIHCQLSSTFLPYAPTKLTITNGSQRFWPVLCMFDVMYPILNLLVNHHSVSLYRVKSGPSLEPANLSYMYIYVDNVIWSDNLVEVMVKTIDPVRTREEEDGEGKNTHYWNHRSFLVMLLLWKWHTADIGALHHVTFSKNFFVAVWIA